MTKIVKTVSGKNHQWRKNLGKSDEEWDIYTILKYLPIDCLLVTGRSSDYRLEKSATLAWLIKVTIPDEGQTGTMCLWIWCLRRRISFVGSGQTHSLDEVMRKCHTNPASGMFYKKTGHFSKVSMS